MVPSKARTSRTRNAEKVGNVSYDCEWLKSTQPLESADQSASTCPGAVMHYIIVAVAECALFMGSIPVLLVTHRVPHAYIVAVADARS